MYESQGQTQTEFHAGGGELGSQAAPRRRGSGGPQYTRSLLNDSSVRDLVAAACQDTANDLKSDPATEGIAGAGQRWQVSKLEAVAVELRGTD